MQEEVDVSIYKLKNGGYQASYTNPFSNKRIRNKFKMLNEANDFKRKIHAQFITDVMTGYSHLPTKQFLDAYLQLYPRAKMVTRGLPFYNSFVETFGQMAVSDLNKMNLAEWFSKVQKERGYAQRTLPNIKSAMNQFFLYLIDQNIIRENPLDKVKIKKGPALRERVHLSEDEIKELIAKILEISRHQVYPVVYFLVQTGCRLGEALKLKWSQFDLNMGTVEILESKNGEGRLIHVSAQLIEFLKAHPRVSEHVFVDQRDGLGWDMAKYRKQFSKIRNKINFPKYWNNHGFRHAFAYHYLRQGGNIKHLHALLGHRWLEMTVDLYGRIAAKDVEKTCPYNF
jgi:integrase